MRRQRYSHTVCSQDDISTQSDTNEEDQSTCDSLYVQSPSTFPIPQGSFPWTHYNNLELHSASRFFAIDQQQQHQRSFSTINSNNSSFYNINNSFSTIGEHYQDVYSNQSFAQPIFNIEIFNGGATGDSPDLNVTSIGNGLVGSVPATNEYEDQYDRREYSSPPLLPPQQPVTTYPAMSSIGTVFLVLRHCIRVDLTAEKAIFVTNYPGSCMGVMNDAGNQSCIIHPNGKVLQEHVSVHMETGNRAAKFCKRGVVFTSSDHSLAYLVDPSGTKSTSDRFKDLSQNVAMTVFLNNNLSRQFEQQSLAACYDLISEASYRNYSNGDEVWIIGGVRIKQNPWGEVRISANFNRRILRTSPTINNMSIATPFVFMKVSCHPFRHFVVRRGEKAVCAGSTGMAVQNGSQKAGFDRVGRLVLF